MRILQTVIVNSVLVLLCAVLLEAAGTPVVEVITWGADQIDAVVQQIEFELPAWIETQKVEQMVQPVQETVEHTIDWVTQLRGDRR